MKEERSPIRHNGGSITDIRTIEVYISSAA